MKKILAFSLMVLCHTLFANNQPPKLVVQIVVDQLRGDLIHKYLPHLTDKGFHYLISHGIDYDNAHHPHANTVTCAGHATISTGSYPSLHGIVANDWYDKALQKSVYCVEDPNSAILPTPRYKISKDGRSPKNLIASTLSDELVLAQKGRSYAVSLKDRSAITLAGHAGKAFWFDNKNGGFITSKYYYSSYPQWVNEWNRQYRPEEKTWVLSSNLNTYDYAKAPRFERSLSSFGQSFPHHIKNIDADEYYNHLAMSPFADELTADFAITLLRKEHLGQGQQTDYLAISFSSVDVIGHQFGPNSIESEDNIRRLDKTLANFFEALNREVGLQNTLIILTADHGMSDSSPYLQKHGIDTHNPLTLDSLRQKIEESLALKFHLPKNTLQSITWPYLYLDETIINEHHLSLKKVSRYLVDVLKKEPGIYEAYSMPLTTIPNDWLSRKVNKMSFPKRVGDIYLVLPAYTSIEQEPPVYHGSPWRYDAYVPLIFSHPAIKVQRLSTPVRTTDIAPTIANILAIRAPSASTGRPLTEVVQGFRG